MIEIECRLDGVVKCVYCGEETLPDPEMIKLMRKMGYKFYKDGKVWKGEKSP